MWQDLVVVSLWGGLVALDTTAAMQILISRPLVSCSVVGLLLGGFPLGFMTGLIFELLYLDELPVGGAPFNEGNVGATIAAGLAILLDQQLGRPDLAVALAALAGVLMSKAGGELVVQMRTINTGIYSRLLEVKHINPGTVSRYHLMSITLMFAAGAVATFAGVALFFLLFRHTAHLVPASWDRHLHTVAFAFLGVGCGVLLHHFYERKNWWHLAIGLGFGAMLWALTAAIGGGGQ
jgi:PTS system mannose-specific IIC component